MRGRTLAADRRRSHLVAVLMLGATALVTYLAFNPALPFSHPYRLQAVVRSANQLRANSPVRIAGVDVGRVTAVRPGPGATSTIVMDIASRGLPLHRDATLRIRPRLFLEGGFYVDLQPGSPSAPAAADGTTLPLTQTRTPVQLYELLSAFDRPVRGRLRTGLRELATGLADGGAEGLHRAAPHAGPALRDLAVVTQAAQGTAPHDLSTALASAAHLTGALSEDPAALRELLASLNRASGALAAHDRQLAAGVGELDGTLRAAPAALRGIDGALPPARHAITAVQRALPGAPVALRRTLTVVSGLDALVAPGARERTVGALATTFRDLPRLTGRLAGMFPSARPLSDCLRTHIIPVLTAEAPDGALSSHRPVWQDFVHALVGLASASQNFDANGYATRYLFGTGPDVLSTQAIPGVGRLLTSVGSPIQSRPVPLPPGHVPPLRPDAPCTAQPVPSLQAPAGWSGLVATGRTAAAPRPSASTVLHGLTTPAVRRRLREVGP